LLSGRPEFAYDQTLLEDVKDVAFFPSRETRSYDAFVVTMCGDDPTSASVFRLQLATGELTPVYGKHHRPNDTHDSWLASIFGSGTDLISLIISLLGRRSSKKPKSPSFQIRSG